jgi:hypothetical protein
METGGSVELADFSRKPAYFSEFRQNRLAAESPRKTRKDPGAGVATPGVANRRPDLSYGVIDSSFALQSLRAGLSKSKSLANFTVQR